MNAIEKEYFSWLCDIIWKLGDERFENVYKDLFMTPFVYDDISDIARDLDGLDLRREFCISKNWREETVNPNKSSSIFEMMIALAIRMEQDIMGGMDEIDTTNKWFHEMLYSLGFNGDESKDEINDILYKFNMKEYDCDGKGGLFYIEGETDIRDMSIWSQMCAYCNYLVMGGY